MTLTNETRHIKWHETCKCISRLDKIICNSKQRSNKDKCRCECKELIDKGVCDKGFIYLFSYYHCYLKKYGTRFVFNTPKETLIYQNYK